MEVVALQLNCRIVYRQQLLMTLQYMQSAQQGGSTYRYSLSVTRAFAGRDGVCAVACHWSSCVAARLLTCGRVVSNASGRVCRVVWPQGAANLLERVLHQISGVRLQHLYCCLYGELACIHMFYVNRAGAVLCITHACTRGCGRARRMRVQSWRKLCVGCAAIVITWLLKHTVTGRLRPRLVVAQLSCLP
jgi:hypothetical protein